MRSAVTGPGLGIACLVSLLLASAPLAAVEGDGAPMTNEDVVVLVVRGAGERAILEAIERRPPAFDLSDEMVRELHIAGVSDRVLAAMRARQAAFEPEREPSVPLTPTTAELRVAITAAGREPDAGDPSIRLRLPAAVPDAVARSMDLPAGADDRRIRRAAWFAMCLEPRHVPDHWRDRSPLGRDFRFAPRHRLLAFEGGSVIDPDAVPRDPDPDVPVEYRLPASLAVPVEPGAHVLALGLALEIGDRWRVFRTAEVGRVDVGEDGMDVSLRLLAPASLRFEQDLEVDLEGPAGGS